MASSNPRLFWWFTTVDDEIHYSSTKSKKSSCVYDVSAAPQKGAVELTLEGKSITARLEDYKSVDVKFVALNNITSRRKFLDIFKELEEDENDEETCSTEQSIQSTPTCDQSSNHSSSPPSSQNSSSSQPDTKKQYIHQKTLAEEVKMMRSLHPDVASSDRHEFLSTSSREWRKKCADALGYSDHSHSFGGSFREQIYLSTLPSCCFEELLSVFEAYDNGVIRTNRATSGLKPGLFASLVGERREVEVHLLFTSLAAGRLTLEAFRKKAKTLRSSRSEENDVQKLRMENARLRLEVARLNNLLKTLRQTTQTEKDTYAFDGNVTETTEEAIVHVTAGPADDSEENSVLDTAIEENITVVPESPMSSQESVQNDKENQNPKDATASSSAVCGKEQELLKAKERLSRRRLDVQRKREKIATPVPISLNTIEKGAVLHAFYSPDKKWYKATVLGKRKSPPGVRVKYVEDGFKEVVPLKYIKQ